MAFELRGMIELSDITAVEFRCSECGYARIRNLDELRIGPPGNPDFFPGTAWPCPKCKSKWEFDNSLYDFLAQIRSHAAKKRNYSVHLVGEIVGRPRGDAEQNCACGAPMKDGVCSDPNCRLNVPTVP